MHCTDTLPCGKEELVNATFEPGIVENAFEVTFDGSYFTWVLDRRSAPASRFSPGF
ncbi:MAG: hypothetical protein AAGF95_31625 [Chloroflexota bacterium]